MRRDRRRWRSRGSRQSFNPRACVRRDAIGPAVVAVDGMFQSTRLREARPQPLITLPVTITFQSTRLREARPGAVLRSKTAPLRFNPRACVRRDLSACLQVAGFSLFQSTRLREARLPVPDARAFINPFQSTRLREARPRSPTTSASARWFQSTRLREARRGDSFRCWPFRPRFNPRACVRRDRT